MQNLKQIAVKFAEKYPRGRLLFPILFAVCMMLFLHIVKAFGGEIEAQVWDGSFAGAYLLGLIFSDLVYAADAE